MKYPPKTAKYLAQHPCLAGVLRLVALLAASTLLALGLHNASTYRTGTWDDYSQALVFGRMLQMQQNQSAPGGFMGVYTEGWGDVENRYLYRDNTPVPPESYQSYTHQSGLQGWGFGVANKLLSVVQPDGGQREIALYLLNSILFYSVALTVGWALWRRWGLLAGAGWVAAILCAPWLQRGMKDLYWCLWLWLVPLLAGLAFCAAVAKRGTAPPWAFGLVFAACMARCLCGFEFVSAYLILCEAPLFCAWVAANSRAGRRAWFGRLCGAGCAALGGVAAALGVWLVQGRLYYGNWAESLQNVAGAASSRLSVSDNTVRAGVTVPGVLYKYIVADQTVVLQLGGLSLTLWQLLCLTLAVLAVAVLLLWRLDKARLAAILPPLCGWVLTFLAPVSWMVLSKAHADIHVQLVPMLWQVAFVPGCCALWGLLVAQCGGAAANASRRAKNNPK